MTVYKTVSHHNDPFSTASKHKNERVLVLINLRIAFTLSFSEKIFLHVNRTYLAVTLHSLLTDEKKATSMENYQW